MGLCNKLIFLGLTGLVVFIGISVNNLLKIPPVPKLENTWWGPGNPTKEDTSIKPYKIKISDEVINDLKSRLDNVRPFVPPLENIQQQYGMNTNLLKEIVEFWKTKYNWRDREQFLNKYPQYTTSIQGLQIHFIHVKPTTQTNGLQVVPLLLLHGWPGSVREFYEIIPRLTAPQKGRNFVFEVIVPSLPGYGFSQGAAKPGLGAAQMSVIFNNLMRRLGFEKYYLQGGDWGALIVASMATLYPNNVLGVHSNMCFVNTPTGTLKQFLIGLYPSWFVSKEYEHKVGLSEFYSFLLLEGGYWHLQATKPDTVGVALNDSPVGLAAYILEKFTTWTNPDWKNKADGGLKLKYSYTDLLDNVMIYWVTGSITTSVRLYSEAVSKAQFALEIDKIPIEVPSACARFPHEISYVPDIVLQGKYLQLVQTSDFPTGGHFAAFEEPELLANDIWAAVQKMRSVGQKQK